MSGIGPSAEGTSLSAEETAAIAAGASAAAAVTAAGAAADIRADTHALLGGIAEWQTRIETRLHENSESVQAAMEQLLSLAERQGEMIVRLDQIADRPVSIPTESPPPPDPPPIPDPPPPSDVPATDPPEDPPPPKDPPPAKRPAHRWT